MAIISFMECRQGINSETCCLWTGHFLPSRHLISPSLPATPKISLNPKSNTHLMLVISRVSFGTAALLLGTVVKVRIISVPRKLRKNKFCVLA